MKKYICLYNPYSGNYHGFEYATKITDVVTDMITFKSLPDIEDFESFFKEYKEDIIICGGDGTLNQYINRTKELKYDNQIYYYSTGTGNDFYNDIGNNDKGIINITKYLKDLPKVEINNQEYLFLNNVAFGLDGYCCLEGERQKKKSNKPINYTKVALKGLLGDYTPTSATIIADGVEYKFNKVWMAPTMHGRYYGGGMMIAPDQNRLEHELSLVIVHDCTRLRFLTVVPTVFKGKHIKYTDYVTIIKANDIEVTYDENKPVQIDGEVIPNVKKYTIHYK